MKKILLSVLIALLLFTGCASNIKDGISCLEEGKYEEAAAAFQLELDEGKNLDEANRGMALAQYELGNYKDAVSYFQAALEHETEETTSIYHLMGTCSMQYEDYEGAIMYFDKALEMEDCTDEVRKEMMFNRIAAYESLGDWEGAKMAASRYLNLYPDDEQVLKEAEFLETR